MRFRKTITIILSISLLATSFGTVFADVAKDGTIAGIKIPFMSNNSSKVSTATEVTQPVPQQKIEDEETAKQKVIMVDSQEKNLFHKSSRMIIADQKEHEMSKSNFKKGEIKQLLEEGYDVKDILEADALCNKIHEKPSTLLNRKKSENIEWKELEDKIKNERRNKNLKKLKEKYPEHKKKLDAMNLSEDEQYMLLAFIDLNEVSSVDNLVQEYKKGGQANLAKLIKPKKDKEVR